MNRLIILITCLATLSSTHQSFAMAPEEEPRQYLRTIPNLGPTDRIVYGADGQQRIMYGSPIKPELVSLFRHRDRAIDKKPVEKNNEGEQKEDSVK